VCSRGMRLVGRSARVADLVLNGAVGHVLSCPRKNGTVRCVCPLPFGSCSWQRLTVTDSQDDVFGAWQP
jgi:hypothetical protein